MAILSADEIKALRLKQVLWNGQEYRLIENIRFGAGIVERPLWPIIRNGCEWASAQFEGQAWNFNSQEGGILVKPLCAADEETLQRVLNMDLITVFFDSDLFVIDDFIYKRYKTEKRAQP